jgi:hypothetical protein
MMATTGVPFAGSREAMESLAENHRTLIEASRIGADVAAARGYRTVYNRAELRRLGFGVAQQRTPALLIPIWDVHGQLASYQIRPDEPRIRDGKPVKYETATGTRLVVDVPPSCRPLLADPSMPLFLTEGVRKADAGATAGLCVIDVLGVWAWRGTNERGGRTALPDWESIALNNRAVYIAYDSDVTTKPGVRQALGRLKPFLEGRGARVQIIQLPPGPHGEKVGLDDFLASGLGISDLMALVQPDVSASPGFDDDVLPYGLTNAGLVWHRRSADGIEDVALTNFGARITAEIAVDDGLEEHRVFEIEATVGEGHRALTVPARAFAALGWVPEQLGARAVIYAGVGTREHARVAIQLLSGTPEQRVVYSHLGWRQIKGAWRYLHAGGGLGPDGPDGPAPDVETRLDGPLVHYVLPEPPAGQELADDVAASLRLLDLAPDRLMVPLLAAVYRAPLGTADFSIHLVGQTGVFKSELAALAQQHYGAGMDRLHLPAAWSSTENSLEALAFAAKDALLVLDDFAPTGSTVDIQRWHARADRVLRAQGNRSGRGRLRSDGTFAPTRPPRGLILSTGEDVPRGQSLRPRMLVLEVSPGDVDADRLTVCQADALAGRNARAFAGYIRWLADPYQAIMAALPQRVAELRARAVTSAPHRRTPEVLANLAIGMATFLEFAVESGALSAVDYEVLWERAWRALGESGSQQAEQQLAANPAQRFIELLGSGLASLQCHVANPTGGEPPDAAWWGWRLDTVGENDVWRPGGPRIGWLVGADLLLDPGAAYSAAQRLGRDTGESLSVTSATLHRRLHEAGFLKTEETPRRHHTVRRSVGGVRHTVLHLEASTLREPAHVAQPAPRDQTRPPMLAFWANPAQNGGDEDWAAFDAIDWPPTGNPPGGRDG